MRRSASPAALHPSQDRASTALVQLLVLSPIAEVKVGMKGIGEIWSLALRNFSWDIRCCDAMLFAFAILSGETSRAGLVSVSN